MLLASRIIALTGGAGFFVASFLTWYWGEGRGVRVVEIGWEGEESVAAIICMLLAMALLAVGWAWADGWLAMGILELLLGIGCFGLTLFHIIHNSQPVVINGRELPTGIGAGPWVGLVASVVMIVGAILNLASGGPYRVVLDEEYEYEEAPPPRHRRPREPEDWQDLSRRRRPHPARRRPPRRRQWD